MITTLPPGFISSINATSRKPIQLAHIHFGDLTCYYSDTVIGIADGLMFDYEPRVESWGTLKDTSNIDASFEGDSLEVRSTSLTLILTGDARDNFVDLLESGIENSIVEIYQWFVDHPEEPPQLIDVFIAQDPIGFSESSALFKMDLVSVIMKNNPYLWDRQPGVPVMPIVVGKVPNMPLIDLQTARWTTLDQDMTYNSLGTYYIGNGVGFRVGPDTMVIDSEIVGYSWITASAINITSRGLNGTIARPHLAGARIFHPDSVFDYAISAGPVTGISDLIADGVPYTNQVLFLAGQDPTIARFIGRPPWVKVSASSGPPIQGDSGQNTVYANETETAFGEDASAPLSPNNVNTGAGYCEMLIDLPAQELPDIWYDIYPDLIEADIPGGTADDYTKVRGYVFDNSQGWLEIGSDPILGCSNGSYATIRFNINQDVIESLLGPYSLVQDDDYDNSFNFELVRPSIRSLGIDANITASFGIQDASGITPNSQTLNVRGYDINQTDPVYYPLDEWPDVFAAYFAFADVNPPVPDYGEQLKTAHFILEFNPYDIRCANETGWDLVLPNLEMHWKNVYWKVRLRPRQLSENRPWQEVLAVFDKDVIELQGNLIRAQCAVTMSTLGDNVNRQVIARSTSAPEDNIVLYSDYTSTVSDNRITVLADLPISSFSELQGYKVGVNHQLDQPEFNFGARNVSTRVTEILWILDWSYGDVATPDERRVVYSQDLTCTVSGILGENPTPPQVIEYFLVNSSPNGPYVDEQEFYRQHLQYLAAEYYFNGILQGDIRLHEALKQCLFEGMCRFLFAEGYIRLLTYNSYINPVVDFDITEDMVMLRSKEVNNQATSTIKNNVDLYYEWNQAEGSYDSNETVVDVDSVNKYELQQSRLEMTLIRSQEIAQIIADYNLERRKNPLAIYSLTMFMVGYQLQKGDRVSFNTIHREGAASGWIAGIDRQFGQGKNKVINTFKLQISEPRVTGPNISLVDSITINEEGIALGGGVIQLDLTDRLAIKDDSLALAQGIAGQGYGGSSYGTGGYGE